MIKAGDKAPSFTLTDQNGDKVAMKDFGGQKVADHAGEILDGFGD